MIIIWLGTGYGHPVHIKYGQALLLTSDVVHGGGTPKLESTSGKKFYRLHYYLESEIQKGFPGVINRVSYDRVNPLSVMHLTPKNTFD
jgi:hypothetical protein